MADTIAHNKILKKIVKENFKPFGIIQKGNSRTFLDDHGWFTTIIEFQPSSFNRGTYLNIGIDFNFYPRDYFAFLYSVENSSNPRIGNYLEFQNVDSFAAGLNKLSSLAIEKVLDYRNEMTDFQTAIESLISAKFEKQNIWNCLDLAIIYGLNKNFDKAKKSIEIVRKSEIKFEWQKEKFNFANQLLVWIEKEENFELKISQMIQETRNLKKLPNLQTTFAL